MKSKKFVLAGLALLAITGLLALTSCKNDSVSEAHTQVSEAHTHTFDETKWESNATGHWRPATCGHTEERGGFASHTFDWEVQTPSTDTEAGKLVKKCRTCSEPGGDEMEIPAGFVYIPAGTFQMGSTAGEPDEKPAHGVTISKGYFMGRHEVTQQLYLAVMKEWGGRQPSSTYGEGHDYPAYYVSWYDAVVYCNRRSIAERLTPCYAIGGKTDPDEWGTVPTSNDSKWNGVTCDWNANGYRLPTEAEWEYAARAEDATTNKITWSGTKVEDDLENYAWYSKNSGNEAGEEKKTHQVGMLAPNAWGLYDMSGNVWEWCWDWYDEKYYSSSSTESGTNPTGPTHGSSGGFRVFRGGSWDSSADNCSVSLRNGSYPNGRYNFLGFRLVRPSSK